MTLYNSRQQEEEQPKRYSTSYLLSVFGK
jgi:hypothetical protein